MRKLLYFRVIDTVTALNLLKKVADTDIIGDPSQDTALYGSTKDRRGKVLFWGVGWGNTSQDEWLFIEWKLSDPPSDSLMRYVFSILDHEDVQAELYPSPEWLAQSLFGFDT
jgi:hypothetical protein